MKARIIGTNVIIDVIPSFTNNVMIGYAEIVENGKGETERYWSPSALQIIDNYRANDKEARELKFSVATAYMSLECSKEGIRNKHQYEQIALKAVDVADALIGVLRKRGEL